MERAILMDIKIPRVRIIRPQHVDMIAEDILKKYLSLAFWVSPFAFWKIWELIKPYLGA
jgi:hypothetical protein